MHGAMKERTPFYIFGIPTLLKCKSLEPLAMDDGQMTIFPFSLYCSWQPLRDSARSEQMAREKTNG